MFRRVDGVDRHVAQGQFVFFPYARIARLFGYFRFSNLSVFHRVAVRADSHTVGYERNGVFYRGVDGIDRHVAQGQFVFFPYARIARLFGYFRFSNLSVFYRIAVRADSHAVGYERNGIFYGGIDGIDRHVAQGQFVFFPCACIARLFGYFRFGNLSVFYRIAVRADSHTVGYERNGVFYRGVDGIDRHVAQGQFVFFPYARIARLFGYFRNFGLWFIINEIDDGHYIIIRHICNNSFSGTLAATD